MKASLLFLFIVFAVNSTSGQGRLNIAPVPVTNGLTGTLADASINAMLYYGPTGTGEDGVLPLPTPSALVNGFATFNVPVTIPAFPSGTAVTLQVRAWSGIYPSYETAVGSGLSSTLAGKSSLHTATVGGVSSPPPVPDPLVFPGFTIWPVPEPTATTLGLLSVAMMRWRAKLQLESSPA